jgi:hypothetical protein
MELNEMEEYVASEGIITLLERIAGYEIIIAVSIAVLGWIITHWFNRKAQKEQLINSIKNEARLDITYSLREYQKWLSGIKNLDSFIVTLDFTRDEIEINKELIKDVAEQVKRGCHELNFEESILWKHRLEEYEILFPKTIKLRKEMNVRDRYINDKQLKIAERLITNDSIKQYDAINEIGNEEFNKFIVTAQADFSAIKHVVL